MCVSIMQAQTSLWASCAALSSSPQPEIVKIWLFTSWRNKRESPMTKYYLLCFSRIDKFWTILIVMVFILLPFYYIRVNVHLHLFILLEIIFIFLRYARVTYSFQKVWINLTSIWKNYFFNGKPYFFAKRVREVYKF